MIENMVLDISPAQICFLLLRVGRKTNTIRWTPTTIVDILKLGNWLLRYQYINC